MPIFSRTKPVAWFATRVAIVATSLLAMLVVVVAIDHLNEASFLYVAWTLCGLIGAVTASLALKHR